MAMTPQPQSRLGQSKEQTENVREPMEDSEEESTKQVGEEGGRLTRRRTRTRRGRRRSRSRRCHCRVYLFVLSVIALELLIRSDVPFSSPYSPGECLGA